MLIPSSTLKGFRCSLFFVGLIFLTACGESVKRRISPHGDTVYIFGSENEASKIARNWNVVCQDPSQCPNSVGQLIMKVGPEIGVCTATLIENDTAITNSHCFDFADQPVSHDDICKSGTAMVFASNSSLGREIVECKSVVAKSSIKSGSSTVAGFLNPDFMIIKLKRPVLRGFEKFNFGGLQEGMKLRIPKVNPQGAGFGLLVTDTCEVLHGTYLLPSADDSLAPVHVLRGCHVIGGNSGSALFDSSGLVRGLVFATFELEKLNDPSYLMSADMADVFRRVKPSLATNAACISHLDGHKEPYRCFKGRTDTENELLKMEMELIARLTRDLVSFQARDRLGYDVRRSPQAKKDEIVLVYRPVCLRQGHKKNSQYYVLSPVLKWTLMPELTEKLKLSLNIRSESATCSFRVHTIDRNQAVAYAYQELCQGLSTFGESWAPCP